MTPVELQDSILVALKKEAPVTRERALACVNEVLADYPKEKKEFGDWFERHSAYLLQRINGA